MLKRMGMLSIEAADRVYNSLKAMLFPPACLFCQAPLTHGRCCPACHMEIRIWPLHACPRCGREMPEGMGEGLCGRCLRKPPPQAGTISLYLYHGPVRQAILDWKLGGHAAAVRWLIEAARPRLRDLFRRNDLLLPVPMPISRMRRRGQHHAARLSLWLASMAECRADWRILRRRGEQPRQSSLPAKARWRNLRQAFMLDADYLKKRQPLAGVERLWIVDDILTSGATLYHAARAAKQTGLAVHVLSLARTPYED